MQISDWISISALAVSLVSGAITLIYARTQHKLNLVQLDEKKRDAADRKIVTLKAELIKQGSSWLVRTTNVGMGTAVAVTVACQGIEGVGALLENEDIGLVTPVGELRTGQHFDVKATNWYGMSGPQTIRYNWNDEEEGFFTTELKVLVD
jgi:hypothetical protein